MSLSAEIFNNVCLSLKATQSVDSKQRKEAEAYLDKLKEQEGFGIALLKIVGSQEVEGITKVSAALYFKNLVKKYWASRDAELQSKSVISQADREQIKSGLLSLMLAVPPKEQKLISAAISIISETDFPNNWKSLLPELVSKLNTQDINVINGLLGTAHSIFKKFRHMVKQNEVLGDMKYILELFQEPFLKLCQMVTVLIDQNASNEANLCLLFKTLKLLCHIFLSLNSIELPEFFEENLKEFMGIFKKFLVYQTNLASLVGCEDDVVPGLLHKVQTAIFKSLHMLIEKNEEEFAPFLQEFVTEAWNLLVKLSNDTRCDALCAEAIGLLASVCKGVNFNIFQDKNTIQMLCEKVIIPNMKLREIDLEQFEDNPQDYLRRDWEGSDFDTRRRSATELVKALRKHFEQTTTEICAQYINQLIQEYTSNPTKNWVCKDVAIYLVTALTVKTITTAKGTTSINPLVPIVDFYNAQIQPELFETSPKAMVLLADAIKFVIIFRQQLPKQSELQILPALIKALDNPNYVVHSYAAIALDKLFLVREVTSTANLSASLRFTKEDTAQLIPAMVKGLFNIYERGIKDNQYVSRENEFAMRALMRLIQHTGAEGITQLSPAIARGLAHFLGNNFQNASNPIFYHNLFEAVAALVAQTKGVLPPENGQVVTYEVILFPVFEKILAGDVADLTPYVFQIMAQLLELAPTISQIYLNILQPLLAPALWERNGNIPALTRLLQAYLAKGAKEVLANNLLNPILGVFQKLATTKSFDHEGFYLLESIAGNLTIEQLTPNLPGIFTVIFNRLKPEYRTPKFIKLFLVWISFFICKHGAAGVVKQIEAMQPGLFQNILEAFWFPNVTTIRGEIERKMGSIAGVKMCTEIPAVYTNGAVFVKLLNQAVEMLQPAEEEDTGASNIGSPLDEDEDEMKGYDPAFAKLAYGDKVDVDPFKDINSKQFLTQTVLKLSSSDANVASLIQTLPTKSLEALKSYINEFK